MRIPLSTQDVKKFLEVSTSIQLEDRKFSPPLSYLRFSFSFGQCEITKANMNSFCRYTFDCGEFMEDHSMYVDFETLNMLVSQSKSTIFYLEIQDKLVWIRDGYYNHKFSTADASLDNYPQLAEVEDADFIRLNMDAMKAIQIGKLCIGSDDLTPQFNACYIARNHIYASDRFSMTIKRVEDTGISLGCIQKNDAILLSQFNYIDFYNDKDFNFFKFENATFGSRKKDGYTGFDYSAFQNRVKKDNFVTIKSEDIINFCRTTIAMNKSKIATSRFQAISDSKVFLSFEDETSNGNEMEIECGLVGGKFEFLFEPDRFANLIKALGYPEICIGNGGSFSTLWNSKDDSFIGMIQNVVPQVKR